MDGGVTLAACVGGGAAKLVTGNCSAPETGLAKVLGILGCIGYLCWLSIFFIRYM
jgi:hypothetical protein